MTWAGVIAAIDADLVTAGATLSPTVTAIRQGEPADLNTPIFAYWYAGDRESTTGGNTLGKTNIEEAVHIRAYFPAGPRFLAGDANLETYIRAAKAAIKNTLWADVFLNTHAIGIRIEDTTSGWTAVGAAEARSFEFTVWVDLAFVDDITV